MVGGRYTIRVAIGGVTTGAADVDALWDLLRGCAERVTRRVETSGDVSGAAHPVSPL